MISKRFEPLDAHLITQMTGGDYKGLKKAGGGILLTRDSLTQRQDNLIDIPVHLFLAMIQQ